MKEFDYSQSPNNTCLQREKNSADIGFEPYNAQNEYAEKSAKRKNMAFIKSIAAAVAALVIATGLLTGCVGALFADDDNDKMINVGDSDDVNEGKDDSSAEEENGGENESADNTSSGSQGSNSVNINKHDGGYDKINSSSSLTDVVAAIRDSVVEIQISVKSFGYTTNTGAGSGVIISKEGYIVTNHHVIEDATTISVRLTNGKEYDATLIGTDSGADIAVIKIEPKETLTVAELGSSSSLLLGEEVIAIGNPLGLLGGTVTRGIISGLERTVSMEGGNYMKLLQTDAAINPGNSGGGLFDLGGKLIGVVNAKYAAEDIEGLGFAIPIDYAYDIIKDLIENGYVTGVADHGLSLMQVNSAAYAQYYFNTRKTGVFVTESKYTTALKYGDRLVSINSKAVSTLDDVSAALAGLEVGDKLQIEYERSGSKGMAEITLREYIPTK